jgi:hypothetical protein
VAILSSSHQREGDRSWEKTDLLDYMSSTAGIEKKYASKYLPLVLSFNESREDPRMAQRTLGFKKFRNFLYFPNKTRMVKGGAKIRNSLTRQLADFIFQPLVFGTQRQLQFNSSVFHRFLRPPKREECILKA